MAGQNSINLLYRPNACHLNSIFIQVICSLDVAIQSPSLVIIESNVPEKKRFQKNGFFT